MLRRTPRSSGRSCGRPSQISRPGRPSGSPGVSQSSVDPSTLQHALAGLATRLTPSRTTISACADAALGVGADFFLAPLSVDMLPSGLQGYVLGPGSSSGGSPRLLAGPLRIATSASSPGYVVGLPSAVLAGSQGGQGAATRRAFIGGRAGRARSLAACVEEQQKGRAPALSFTQRPRAVRFEGRPRLRAGHGAPRTDLDGQQALGATAARNPAMGAGAARIAHERSRPAHRSLGCFLLSVVSAWGHWIGLGANRKSLARSRAASRS
jgi:hypothetical protein